jgi:hypothetical protein
VRAGGTDDLADELGLQYIPYDQLLDRGLVLQDGELWGGGATEAGILALL